jgi:hypothetical protein
VRVVAILALAPEALKLKTAGAIRKLAGADEVD